MSLLVLHHDPQVGHERLDASLAARPLEVVPHDATSGQFPAVDDHDGVLVLGSRDSVVDRDERPSWMEAELAFLRACTQSDVPVFGICLGAQLLAVAHGGQVAHRDTPEVAMVAVHRTTPGTTDDVTAGWPDGAPSLAYHEDEVTMLPEEAVQLLVGSDGPTLWRIGSAHATQLHPEAGIATLRTWVEDLSPDFPGRAGVDAQEFLERAERLEVQSRAAGTSLLMRWVDGLG